MSQESQPLVSIVIPCYNHESFVQDCIRSVIDQTYQNIELIIIDDGSKDNSVAKIQELLDQCKARFTRFEFRHRPNQGLSATLNEALEWCHGAFWTTCSSDDYYHKNKIIKQINFLLKNTDTKFCVTKSFVVNDLNEVLSIQTENYNLGLNETIKFDDIFTFKIHLPVTGLYEINLLRNTLNGFDPKITAEDYDIYLRIAENTEIGVLDEMLYYYRSPEALGGDRQRMPMRLDVSESHHQSINKYKDSEKYDEAINAWNYRRFIFFSGYSKNKGYAFQGMLRALHYSTKVQFYKSLFKLIFIWK